ncbi:MAG: alpha/beta hydrolase [Lachnospiraceae bacterium]|nr:alpha/beta hydrolase [Lachnospiraceae bacterium]
MNRYDIRTPITFKKGMYRLSGEEHFNYQLCRTVNWSGGDLDEIRAIGCNIRDFNDWKEELLKLGEKAESEDRMENAIAYYRMADFYTSYSDPDKLPNYRRARNLFYEYFGDYFEGGTPIVERLRAKYNKKTSLPILHCLPEGKAKGLILMHGGNDSYMEEFFFPMLYLRENGYEVYLYEGPGQGEVIRNQNCPFTWQWEKTTKAITEKYDLHDAAIIGISLGGYFAPRAAAFDKRISRVVAWSVYPGTWDVFAGQMGEQTVKLLKNLLKMKGDGLIDRKFESMRKKGDLGALTISDMCRSYGVEKVSELGHLIENFDLRNCAKLVNQDMLILGADRDIMIDRTLAGRELDLLTNTHSLTYVELKSSQEAGDHCNVGNPKLALDTILSWMAYMDRVNQE